MNEKLMILWVTRDKEAALNMLIMYATNAMLKHWWEEVTVVIWGPSMRLAVEDPDIQYQIQCMACGSEAAGVY